MAITLGGWVTAEPHLGTTLGQDRIHQATFSWSPDNSNFRSKQSVLGIPSEELRKQPWRL